jgi:hypothetical protein
MRIHLLELVGILETIAAVGRIDALEGEVPAALTRRLAIALDLTSLAFVARD